MIIGRSFLLNAFYNVIRLVREKDIENVWLDERKSWLGVYQEPRTTEWKEAWAITEECIRRFWEKATGNGSKFTLLIVADSIQIGREHPRYLGSMASMFDLEYPNRRLSRFCKRNNIQCIDSLPYFLERKSEYSYPWFSWAYDGHYSPLGHRTMAEFLLLSEVLENIWGIH